MIKNDGTPLSVRARLMKALGEELITSDIVAIIELVKNSYDADANNVLIRFSDVDQTANSTVEVIDDGCGMSITDIKSKWMEIATTSKRTQTHSDTKTRRYLGAKGIGRFATSRLANELELVSKEKASQDEAYAYFDWSQFDDDELFLQDVLFLAESRPIQEIEENWRVPILHGENDSDKENRPKGHGTILRMTHLKRRWSKSDFIELHRALSRLVSPYKELQDFSIYIETPYEIGNLHAQVSPPTIVNYPHYRCVGRVSSDGSFDYKIYLGNDQLCEEIKGHFFREESYDRWELVASPNEIDQSDIEKGSAKPVESGPFEFDLKFWDRDELDSLDQKLKLGIRALRQDLNHICGINIYRDGFRVLPYGEPNNDWLRLDVRRVQKPTMRFSNNQIFGHISITADRNPELKDSSNREGLDDTSGFRDLQSMMIEILLKVENFRYGFKRGSKQKNTSNIENPGLFDEPDFSNIKSKLEKSDTSYEEIAVSLAELENKWKWQLTELKEKVAQYHSLASLGAIADKIVHDGSNPLARIVVDAEIGELIQGKIIDSLGDNFDKRLSENHQRFTSILKNSEQVRSVFRHIEPFGGRKRGRPKKLYAEEIIKDTFDFYAKEIESSSISFELPKTDSLVKIDEAELRQVLQNLLMNSLYWLKKVPKGERMIVVNTSHDPGNHFEIIFADSGPGVSDNDRDKIFEPYVSGRTGGSGMGLAIAGEILRDYYNGGLELLENKAGRGAVFRAIFRERV